MKVLGAKIQQARKSKRLSQIALAEGICTQATVSKIENKNSCESLDVFSSICSKLELPVFDCLEETYEQKIERILNEVEYLCEQIRPDEAYKVLKEYNLDEQRMSYFTKTKFLYYKGSTALLGKSYFEEALAYLKQVINMNKKIYISYFKYECYGHFLRA